MNVPHSSKYASGEFQTRSEEAGLCFFRTYEQALQHAKADQTVWKISWISTDGISHRYVKDDKDGVFRSRPLLESL